MNWTDGPTYTTSNYTIWVECDYSVPTSPIATKRLPSDAPWRLRHPEWLFGPARCAVLGARPRTAPQRHYRQWKPRSPPGSGRR